jgi:cbb3-type cytochrome oxidase subunit 1
MNAAFAGARNSSFVLLAVAMLGIGLDVGVARLGQLSGPAVAGLVADWFGLSAIGLMAAAIYGAGMFAAAADGFFGQRTMTTSLKEDRHALPASWGIIRERVNAGLARARANGVKLGRRRIKPSNEADIVKLRAKGDGIHKIRKKLGVGASVVQRVFREVPWRSA